ncbi:hypothetical protein PIB30_079913 [Stylosanthes scabra]|uniref:Uncharacterized protein n=1 Tax=Stylosanthes scabra TaxID=79078 RepID=A0ABU6YNV5_9FABA|nr:hypothetical protein [Stylosanthes scabra]
MAETIDQHAHIDKARNNSPKLHLLKKGNSSVVVFVPNKRLKKLTNFNLRWGMAPIEEAIEGNNRIMKKIRYMRIMKGENGRRRGRGQEGSASMKALKQRRQKQAKLSDDSIQGSLNVDQNQHPSKAKAGENPEDAQTHSKKWEGD